MSREHRNTIVVETATVTANEAYQAQQHIVRLHAPRIAARALPGQFVHVRCAEDVPMRRPMSIMRVNSEQGWVDFLFKVHGLGTARLGSVIPQSRLNVMGPIGNPFRLEGYKPHALLIGGGVGIPPMVFLAEHLRRFGVNTMVLMGSEIPFPFTPRPSQILLKQLPNDVIAAMPLFEDWGIPSRLASLGGFPGCFEGFVTELADLWLSTQRDFQADDIEIFACGPTPMLRAVAELANSKGIASQLSLEEYMACAVGGCAGCTILTETPSGKRMQRVCVDGPVFDGASVIFS